MAKFPEPPPPDTLSRALRRDADIALLRAGTPLGRIFMQGGDYPVAWNTFRHWGPTSARFDHHGTDGAGQPHRQARGILYAAGAASPGALAVCVAEVFQETRIVDRAGRSPAFAVFRLRTDVHLLDLRGLWPTRAGASLAIASGPRSRARRWSQAIYTAFPDISGLIYPSSMAGGGDAVALFERAKEALPVEPIFRRDLADPALRPALLTAANAIDYDVI